MQGAAGPPAGPPAGPEGEERWEELAAAAVAHFQPRGDLIGDSASGTNKGGLSPSPLPSPSSPVSHFSSVGRRLRSMAYFPALTHNGNQLNLFLCERLSHFN